MNINDHKRAYGCYNVFSPCKKIILLVCFIMSTATTMAVAQVSNIKTNETVQFFRTSAWFDYESQRWHIPIHAWVYESQNSKARKKVIAKALKAKYNLLVNESTREYFDQRVNLLLADNESGKKLVLKIGSKNYQLPKTNARGHIDTVLKLSAEELGQSFAKQDGSIIRYEVVLKEGDGRLFEGHTMLVAEQGISLISDIDDTVKVSYVTDKKKLMDQTFYQEFQAVEGMADLYQKMDEVNIPLHFVSSSPWHLYKPLDDFFEANQFPKFTASLKTIRLKDSSILNLFRSGEKTKPKQIQPILDQYPHRRFILIGDSGEQDPEVYEKILLNHPERIIAIYIRSVTDETKSSPRFQQIAEAVGINKLVVFSSPQEIFSHLSKLNVLK